MNEETLRIGRFTSSQMYRLCASLKSGKPSAAFYTYVEEIKIERMLGRSVKVDVKTRPMRWGSLLEVVLFDLLGLNYSMEHKNTKAHPLYKDFWSGTPDLVADYKTGEIKCFEPLHFAKLSIALETKDTEIIKDKEPQPYWQSISNSLIYGFDKAEILAYMPYKKELIEIIDKVETTNFLERNNLNPSDYYFLTQDNIDNLPYLPDDSKMSNINSFEFEIPKEDKEFLIERVKLANELLNE